MAANRILQGTFVILLFGVSASCSSNPPLVLPGPAAEVAMVEMTEGDTLYADASDFFRDPDGDSLTYTVATTDRNVADVSVYDGSFLRIDAVAEGSTALTITARDPRDLAATLRIGVEVVRAVTVAIELCRIDRSSSAVAGRPTSSFACENTVAYLETIETSPSVQSVTRVTEFTIDQGQIGGAVVSTDNQIYYWHLQDTDTGAEQANLWKTPVSGVSRTPVTAGRSFDIDPSVASGSPNMVFASNRNGRPSSLWIVDEQAGVGLTMATQSLDADYLPSQSPDGAWVAFERWLPGVDRPHIWTLDLTTGFETQLREGHRPRVSPDGSRILYNRRNPDTDRFEIWLMDADGGGETLLSTGADHDEIQPSWSPDGQAIVYVSNEGLDGMGQANYDVWTLSITQGTRSQLTTNGSHDDEPIWHPDGRIFFRSNRGGAWNIWYLTAASLLNEAPELVGTIPAEELGVGERAVINVSRYFRDPERASLVYAPTTSDPAVATVSVSGSLIMITATAEGTAMVTVTATDPNGLSAVQDISVTVAVPSSAPEPVGTIPAEIVREGDAVAINVFPYFQNPEGGSLAYAATTSDSTVATVSVAGSVLTVSGARVGSTTITITASNPDGLTAMQSFRITVEAPPRPTPPPP
ncbi:MAG: hypothetical protein OXI33_00055 [Chloroflexota bacterium]|nr:hypothetical protein [Chloroflexota bacterium]